MAGRRQPKYDEPGFKLGRHPRRDRLFFAELLRQAVYRSEVCDQHLESDATQEAKRKADMFACDFYNDPFQIPPDGLTAALLTPDEPRIEWIRLAYVKPGGRSSIQVSVARDDRGRYSLSTGFHKYNDV